MTVRQLATKIAFVNLRRPLQELRRGFPQAYRVLAKAGQVLFPWEGRIWMRGEGGIARGLYFKLNPRFERDFLIEGPPALARVWTDHLTPGAVFYDVGSHIGVFAVSAARMVGREGAVYAFEPDPENCQLIAEHATRNSFPVEIVPKAVWKSVGRMRFVPASRSDPGRMGGFLAEKKIDKTWSEVDTISLDEFAREKRSPTFIKIDVEGAEAEVLEGAEQSILAFSPTLLIEIHSDEAYRRVAEFLDKHAYSLKQLVPPLPLFLARAMGKEHAIWTISSGMSGQR